MKVSELDGALLDYWVARAEGKPLARIERAGCWVKGITGGLVPYEPTADWGLCGPLLDRVGNVAILGGRWVAGLDIAEEVMEWTGTSYGDDPRQAICRAAVRSVFGDDVPEVSVQQ